MANHRSHEPNDWAWANRAACLGRPAGLFFQEGREADQRAVVKLAKVVCSGCPVKSECLEHAMSRPEPFGIWGGYTESQRIRLRQARRRID